MWDGMLLFDTWGRFGGISRRMISINNSKRIVTGNLSVGVGKNVIYLMTYIVK